jgi:hypothetical protein
MGVKGNRKKGVGVDKLKICLQVKLRGKSSVGFRVFYIDENIGIKNGNTLFSDSNMFNIRKGEKFNYSTCTLTLPTDIIKDNFYHVNNFTFLAETTREYLLKLLARKLLKFINNGTFEENPNTRIEYKNDYWLFY